MAVNEKSPTQGAAAKGQIKFTKKEFEVKYSVAMVGGYAVLDVEWYNWRGQTILEDPDGINDHEYVESCAYELAKKWILTEAQKYTRINLNTRQYERR